MEHYHSWEDWKQLLSQENVVVESIFSTEGFDDFFDNDMSNYFGTRGRGKELQHVNRIKVKVDKISFELKRLIIDKYEKNMLKNYKKIMAVIQIYIQKVAGLLGTKGPQNRIPFTEYDKSVLFKAVEMNEKELQEAMNSAADPGKNDNDIDMRNRALNDTFAVLCVILISVFYRHRKEFPGYDPKKLSRSPYMLMALYLGLRNYGSIYVKYFAKFDPNPEIMDYTIENMSSKVIIRKLGNMFEWVRFYAESMMEYMGYMLERNADIDIFYFITSYKSRMNQGINDLAKLYYENYKENNKIKQENMKGIDDKGDMYVADVNNTGATVVSAVNRIHIKFISETILDEKLIRSAIFKTKLSRTKFTLLLTKVRENSSDDIKKILTMILSYFVVNYNASMSDIKSAKFITQMMKVYAISNTNNKNVIGIKDALTNIVTVNGADILKEGNKNMIDRFRAAMYTYLVLFISKNIE